MRFVTSATYMDIVGEDRNMAKDKTVWCGHDKVTLWEHTLWSHFHESLLMRSRLTDAGALAVIDHGMSCLHMRASLLEAAKTSIMAALHQE
jgi:hypothetical protein